MKTLSLSIIVGTGVAAIVTITTILMFLQSASADTSLKIGTDKNQYGTGEPISFFVEVENKTDIYPVAAIVNEQNKTVWYDNDLPPNSYKGTTKVYYVEQNSQNIPMINQTGKYTLVVTYEDKKATEDLTITELVTEDNMIHFYGSYKGIDNDSGTVEIDNQTYSFITIHSAPSDLVVSNDTTITFQGVSFTIPGCGKCLPAPMPFNPLQYVRVHFPDNANETLAIRDNIWSPISGPFDFHEYFPNGTKIFPNGTKGTWQPRLHKDQIVTTLTRHTDPQAGITVTHDAVKFLVSKANYVSADDGIAARYLFMNPNSTAHIYMKFGGIITDNKTKYKGILDVATGNPALDVSITDSPAAPINDSTIIDYKITANNARGLYGIPLGNCGLNPLVIGLGEDEINASLFAKYFLQALPCATYDPARDGVEVNQDGLILKTITINYNKSGEPQISAGNILADTVGTDKSRYQWGDEVTITGRVDGTGMLQLRILNPFLNPVVSKYFFPRSDGTFSQTILAKGPLWSVTGNYTAEISGIPSNTIRATLYFDSNSSAGTRQNIMELQASPLDQLKSGIAVEKIQCNDGLMLVIKAEDESPACVTPQTAQVLGHRGWANQVGIDIVLEKPSSSARPFPICNSNPAKEKLIREKQKILGDTLLAQEEKYGGFKNRTQHLPWSFLGYDCVDNALEVGILPKYFTADLIPKYFEIIRSIVGNSIDVVLSPEEYATLV
jgi:hypothetical protein